MTLTKIEQAPQTLGDIVLERMRLAIIDGTFSPGERLIERKISDQLGVSRTVTREAIRYLIAEGLVESAQNRGPIVALLDWERAKQIYDIRRHLEGDAAATCARQHSAGFPQKLTEALEAIRLSYATKEWAPTFQATTTFYELIFEEAGHSVAWEVTKRLNGRISRLRALTLSSTERQTLGFQQMKAICEAICNADPDAAKRAVDAHLEDAANIVREALEREDVQARSARA